MNFSLSEEHQAIKAAAAEFAQKELLPNVIERDIDGAFPKSLMAKMAEMGFMGVMVPEAYGGAGLDTLAYVIILEEISKIDASAGVIASVNNSLVCWGLEHYGTEEQKQKYLAPLASGQKLGCFCLSEPEAGSDATHQKTTGFRTEGGFEINGIKNWITNGCSADLALVIAQTQPDLKHKGINAFILDKADAGFVVGKKEDKMGIRASDTHSLIFNNVAIPADRLLGKDNEGFAIAMKTLDGGRIGIAAQALGIAQGAYEIALKYSKTRQTFGKPIFEHQAVQFKLVEMHTRIEAARLITYRAAFAKDQGLAYVHDAAMAKYLTSETAMYVTTEAVQILGGNGYVREYHVERMMRDAKITQIYEGTSEIQKLVMGRGL